MNDEVVKQSLRAADQRLYLRKRQTLVEKVKEEGEGEEAAKAEDGGAPAAASVAEAEAEKPINALALVEELILPSSEAKTILGPVIVRTGSQTEHDLLQAQALFSLSSTLLSDVARLGAKSDRRQVVVRLEMAQLADMMVDEMKRTNPRDMLLKSIEGSCPKRANTDTQEIIKQAIELHTLVIIADVRNEQDLVCLKNEAMVEELTSNQLLIIAYEEIMSDKAMAEVHGLLTCSPLSSPELP